MENLRNRVDIKIVRSCEMDKTRHLVSSPLFARHDLFRNDLAGVHMYRSRLFVNKPVYNEMTILENSKIFMYDLFYNHLKRKYGSKCELIYTNHKYRQPALGYPDGRRLQRHGRKHWVVRYK